MTLFRERVNELIEKVHKISTDPTESIQNKLPENCWFLSDDEVACFERSYGDSRYPYEQDGLTLWAYAAGGTHVFDGPFSIILDSSFDGSAPKICFYAGRKTGEKYFPISLTGAGKFPMEENVERYTVFAPEAAYYFTETEAWTSCIRMFVDEKKNLLFSVCLINGEQQTQTYVASFFNPCLRHGGWEGFVTNWFKSCKRTENGFLFTTVEGIFRSECNIYNAYLAVSEQERKMFSTTDYNDFVGSNHSAINCAVSLQNGYFEKEKPYTEFVSTSIAATMIPLELQPGEFYEVSYTMAVSQKGEEAAKVAACARISTQEIDALIYGKEPLLGKDIPKMQFQNVKIDGVQDVAFQRFVKSVFRQAEFCSRAKNYAAELIGIRDIFQQLEASLCWIPDYCRGKILEALNYIGEDGRAPRQYSYPKHEGALPVMDLRPFIDQGVWVISTIYTYLAYTNDDTILDEICGYYKFNGNNVEFSNKKDSVLSHMLGIMEYLISNLDEETNCLHILYGDWNDALDGLGESLDKTSEYGSGVSVMATLQFYQNLQEMAKLMRRLGRDDEAGRYTSIAERVAQGLIQYAIDTNEKYERKIIHGWGDKYSYKIGSWKDNDDVERDGLTSNAFWILSGMIDKDESLKADILRAYERLDSKYGYKTFEPYFSMDNKKVGRIPLLPRGTAENAATYIHAAMFAIWSLFEVGEAELAWKQFEKILPITHEKLSHSPFVMPNSYCYDEEKMIDGESMSDWFTGSGCVLAKIMLWYVFGIKADLDGVSICPANYLPFDKMEIALNVKGGKLTLFCEKGSSNRRFFVNGKEVKSTYNHKKKAEYIYLTNAEIAGKNVQIECC